MSYEAPKVTQHFSIELTGDARDKSGALTGVTAEELRHVMVGYVHRFTPRATAGKNITITMTMEADL